MVNDEDGKKMNNEDTKDTVEMLNDEDGKKMNNEDTKDTAEMEMKYANKPG